MTIERHYGNEDGEKQMGFCQAVRHGNLIYISGTVSWDDSFQPLHVGDMAGQLAQIYATLDRILKQHGLGFDSVVKETGFTTDIEATFAALEARGKYFAGGLFPASTWVEVSQLAHPDLLAEVEMIVAAD